MGEGRILVQATVTAVCDDRFLYPCCVQCYSKMLHDVQHHRWHCLKCGESSLSTELEWRYRLRMTIADTHEYRQVAVFGKTIQPFFGASANTFQRFLSHVQKTESDLADMVLKQAVDLVFVGQAFLFGFASTTRHKPLMTVSCLSHVKETKGSNSDLIAVQMICPDPCQLTTVSQQMNFLFKQIMSNSLNQTSTSEEPHHESFAELKLKQRRCSVQNTTKYFDSFLELSENSINSLASIILSCENSLVNNVTMSPATQKEDSPEGRIDTRTAGNQSQATAACSVKEDNELDETMNDCSFEYKRDTRTASNQSYKTASHSVKEDNQLGETMNDSSLEYKTETRTDRNQLQTTAVCSASEGNDFNETINECGLECRMNTTNTNQFVDEMQITHSEELSGHVLSEGKTATCLATEDDDFNETMNDSSLLLADKDDCFQLLGEKMELELERNVCTSPRSKSDREELSQCPELIAWDERYDDTHTSNTGACVWEDMPYSEGMDEFLSKANECNSKYGADTGTNKMTYPDFIEKPRTFGGDDHSTLCHHNPSSIVCQDSAKSSKTDTLSLSNVNDLQFSFHLKDPKDVSESYGQFETITAATTMDIPESENLDEFLLKAACSESNSKGPGCMNLDNDNVPLDVQCPTSLNIGECSSQTHVTVTNKITPKDRTISSEGIRRVVQSSPKHLQYEDSKVRTGSTGQLVDIEKYFADSFSQENQDSSNHTIHCHGVKKSSQTDQNSFTVLKERDLNTKDSKKHYFENCKRHSVDKANLVSQRNEKSSVQSCHLISITQDCKTDTVSMTSVKREDVVVQTDELGGSLKDGLASRYLLESSLNGSMELFDASGDLFEDCDENLQETVLEGPEHSEDQRSSVVCESAVCESVDESVKVESFFRNNFTETSASQKKKVQFAKRLSHISTVQLIDIRMKLNFGISVESQGTPVKSCMRNMPVSRMKVLKPTVETGSWSSLLNKSEASSAVDESGDTDTELNAFSQDLFACSQDDVHSDISVGDANKLECEVSVVSDEAFPQVMSELSYQYHTNKRKDRTPQITNSGCDQEKKHVTNSYRIENIETKRTRDDSRGTETCLSLSSVSLMPLQTPEDSPLLFSQTEQVILGSQASSTPTGDSLPGDTVSLLPLTPDLFTP